MTTYTTKDLVNIFHMTEQGIRSLFKSGELKAKKIGKQWIVTEDALKKYLELE